MGKTSGRYGMQWFKLTDALQNRLGPIVASHLLALRTKAALSRAQAAAVLGVSDSVYKRLEAGKHAPNLVTIVAAIEQLRRVCNDDGALARLVADVEQLAREVNRG